MLNGKVFSIVRWKINRTLNTVRTIDIVKVNIVTVMLV